MSFKNVDIEAAMRRLAEHRIEEAMREGKFDNLPGAGKPLDLEPMPANENARLAWWTLRILKQGSFTPEEVQYRKQVDGVREELAATTTERRVKALVAAHNQLVHQINTLGTNALPSPVAPLALESELKKLRDRLGLPAPAPRRCRVGGCGAANAQDAEFCRRCGSPLTI
jgi:hypothetical protein